MNVADIYKTTDKYSAINRSISSSGDKYGYNLNIFIVFFFIILILFLYVKNNVKVDEKNWDIQKCNPKYLFFSGYIRRNPNETAYNSTLNNFYECTGNLVKGTNQEFINQSMKNKFKSFQKDLMTFDDNQKRSNQQISRDLNERVNDIEAQLDIMSDDISMSVATVNKYTFLKNFGLYVDQYNAYIDFIQKYIKHKLTYKMLGHAADCYNKPQGCTKTSEEYINAIKYKNILDAHFGGTNL